MSKINTILTSCPRCGAAVKPGEVRQYDTGPAGEWTDFGPEHFADIGPDVSARVRLTPIGLGCEKCKGRDKPND